MTNPEITTMLSINHYLLLSGTVFVLGMMTVLLRKNIIVMLMGIELMLNAVNLTFVAFSQMRNDVSGSIMVFFIMTVAAASVGLALAVAIYKKFKEVNIKYFEQLRG